MGTNHPTSPPAAVSTRGEPIWVAVLCLAAALHVFVYSAAFPFFGNVDEPAHFGTVMDFAQGPVPRTFDNFNPETVRCLALYNAAFYITPSTRHHELLPQPWKLPAGQQAIWLAAEEPECAGTNYENSQPPVYYAIAGWWWNLGTWLGLDEGHRLYWLRFLNMPAVALIVWLGWLAAKSVFPGKPLLRLGVPALIAFMPQSAFYSIENDAFSPLFFGAAFVLLVRLWKSGAPSVWLGAATGLALAGTFLVKMTNVPPLAVTVGFLLIWVWELWRSGKLGPWLPTLAALGACAAVPVATWAIWCHNAFGDFTGSRLKEQYWTWTPKPFLEWWSHPIFTFAGAQKFIGLFLAQFWQGELVCHYHWLTFRPVNWVYALVTAGLLGLALATTIRRPPLALPQASRILWFSFLSFVSCAMFLVYISISFNFNQSPLPSPSFPYLTCGRQALGALIPFMLVFVCGLDRLLGRATEQTKFIILATMILAMLGNEVACDWPAFGDEYNWFHL